MWYLGFAPKYWLRNWLTNVIGWLYAVRRDL